MGNCSGLFANCTDAEGDHIRKIDHESMKMAVKANQEAKLAGEEMVKNVHANALPWDQ